MKLISGKAVLVLFVLCQLYTVQLLIASSGVADTQAISIWVQDHGDYIVKQLKAQGITDANEIDFDAIVRASGDRVQLMTGGSVGAAGGSLPAAKKHQGADSQASSEGKSAFLDAIKNFNKSNLKKAPEKNEPEEEPKAKKISPVGKFAKNVSKPNPLGKAKQTSSDSDSDDDSDDDSKFAKNQPKQQFAAKVGKAKITKKSDEEPIVSQSSQLAKVSPAKKPFAKDSEVPQGKKIQSVKIKFGALNTYFDSNQKQSREKVEEYLDLYRQLTPLDKMKYKSRADDLEQWLEENPTAAVHDNSDDW